MEAEALRNQTGEDKEKRKRERRNGAAEEEVVQKEEEREEKEVHRKTDRERPVVSPVSYVWPAPLWIRASCLSVCPPGASSIRQKAAPSSSLWESDPPSAQ